MTGSRARKLALAGILLAATAGLALAQVSPDAASSSVEIEITDATEYHVFAPGQAFEIAITPRLVEGEEPADLAYQWVDYRGSALTPPAPLTAGTRHTIPSPPTTDVGYYGLKLLPDDGSVTFNPESGSRPEIGFAVLPTIDDRRVDYDSRFGMVHYSYRDPYLNPGWIKTATEIQIGDGSTDDNADWRDRLRRNREQGQIELPMIYRDVWRDGSLGELRALARTVFGADPRFDGTTSVRVYELGREENNRPGPFADILAEAVPKFRGVKEERDLVDPSIQLGYQIAGTGMRPYRRLLESDLAREIDILSAHPYPWGNWPSPDSWHEDFVAELREIMAENDLDLPIWYTEVGSFQNDAGELLMYSGRRPVPSQTRAEYAAYLVKLHAHAFADGVEKVFWYNYQDRSTSTTWAESHFGMRDHWGFPKPGYLAYAAALKCMKGREASRLPGDSATSVFLFSGAEQDCLVAWTVADTEQIAPLGALRAGLDSDHVVEAFNTVGTQVALMDGAISLSTYPVFLLFSKTETESIDTASRSAP